MAAMSAMEPHHVNGSLGEWRRARPFRAGSTGLVRPLAAAALPPASAVEASGPPLGPGSSSY